MVTSTNEAAILSEIKNIKEEIKLLRIEVHELIESRFRK